MAQAASNPDGPSLERGTTSRPANQSPLQGLLDKCAEGAQVTSAQSRSAVVEGPDVCRFSTAPVRRQSRKEEQGLIVLPAGLAARQQQRDRAKGLGGLPNAPGSAAQRESPSVLLSASNSRRMRRFGRQTQPGAQTHESHKRTAESLEERQDCPAQGPAKRIRTTPLKENVPLGGQTQPHSGTPAKNDSTDGAGQAEAQQFSFVTACPESMSPAAQPVEQVDESCFMDCLDAQVDTEACQEEIAMMSEEEDVFEDCLDAPADWPEIDPDCGADFDEMAEECFVGLGQRKEIRIWLESIDCGAHAEAFAKAELSWELIEMLSDSDLQQLGVASLGPRRRILAAAARRFQRGADGPSTSAQQPSFADAARRLAGKASCITDFFRTRSGVTLPKPAPPLQPQAGTSSRRHAPVHAGERGRVPHWQKVPGTSFIVDRFGRPVEDNNQSCKSWFLTHFHADHYGGLSGRFRAGLIYCTKITARLVNDRLNVSMNKIRVVELNQAYAVEGVKVTFLDANHCPGAAMIVFEVPGRRPVLHSGDCRCHAGFKQEPLLKELRQRGADLHLDTTYCSAQYDFPSQQEVLRFVLEAFKAEKYNQGKTLFLIGSYTIGKERLFLEAARILQQKIYVSRAKRKVLEALDLPKEYRVLLTENDREATIQAVPMGMVNLKRMANIAKHYRARFTTIVGIQPTGWTHTAERSKAGRGRRLQKGSLILYSVPYSEHSSCRELQEFVRWLRPVTIVPTVGNDGGKKTASMLALLRH